jgi:hypothetical protein
MQKDVGAGSIKDEGWDEDELDGKVANKNTPCFITCLMFIKYVA